MAPKVTDFGYDRNREQTLPPRNPAVSTNLPSNWLVNMSLLPPVGEQGTADNPGSPGTCCAWASTYCLATYYAAFASGSDPSVPAGQASPASIYIDVIQGYGNSCSNGKDCPCPGSAYVDYLNKLQQSGTPSMANAPYYPSCDELWNKYNGQNIPPESVFRLTSWSTIEADNTDGIKQLIQAGRPVAFATALCTDWNDYSGQNLPVPYVGNHDLSGAFHCMVIVGYDDKIGNGEQNGAFLVQNSQGTVWGTTPDEISGTGDCGYIWICYETYLKYVEQQAYYFD